MRVAQIMAGQNAGGAELFYTRLVNAWLQTPTSIKWRFCALMSVG